MRKFLLATTVLGLAAAAAPALAQDYYGTLGYSNLSAEDTDVDLGAIDARLGARLNPYFAVEGEVGIGIGEETVAGIDVEREYDAAVYAVGLYPVSSNFDIFGRVGFGTTSVEASAGGVTVSEDGESFNYGVGAQYFFDGANGVRGDWTRRDYEDDGEADVWSISYVRRF